jgi:VIT1/CCC1 family predicted Fe2+/Mn2+ transporter
MGQADDATTRSDDSPRDDGEARSLASRLNWLRAGVLGANDGIVSTAGLVVGVAGATPQRTPVLVAGLAGLLAGALSMAGGEYVSVSSQADSERAALDRKRRELDVHPRDQRRRLADQFEGKGLPRDLAVQVADELTRNDAVGAHAEVDLGIDPEERTNPWHAAWSSMIAFVLGALLPLVAIVVPPLDWRLPVTVVAVTVALALTGATSATLGRAPRSHAVARTVGVGLLTMTVTFVVGTLVGRVT